MIMIYPDDLLTSMTQSQNQINKILTASLRSGY